MFKHACVEIVIYQYCFVIVWKDCTIFILQSICIPNVLLIGAELGRFWFKGRINMWPTFYICPSIT